MSERIIRLLDDAPQAVYDDIEDVLDKHGVQYRVEEVKYADPSANGSAPFVKDSATSKKAAKLVFPRTGTQRYRVLMAIADSGDRGMTRDEIWKLMQASHKKMAEGALDARVWELGPKNLGYVEPNGKLRATPSGASAEVLVVSAAGKAAIRQHWKEQ